MMGPITDSPPFFGSGHSQVCAGFRIRVQKSQKTLSLACAVSLGED